VVRRGPGGRPRWGEPRRPGVIYNYIYIYENTQPRFPLLGLRLKNTSGLHLLRGPLTLFEGGTYAGDARVADLQPNEERLLSYAVDLGTEVKPGAADSGRLTHVKAVKGTLYITTKAASPPKLRETKTYTVRDRNPQGRTVLIEHPVRDQFQLADTAKPAQAARDACRFEVKVPVSASAAAQPRDSARRSPRRRAARAGCGWRGPRVAFRRAGQSDPTVAAMRPRCVARADFGI
jgi:hypothetical protein